ncbi:unnamed protein product [Soboliphyme baturini]|uniref:N-chimaerin n=1 Tax=Soboliphyme baturini TaxID=241478 RepID=A0A183ITI0_9BILA|nr:unnamed protein product [Soboliphyme baturini]
MSDQTCSGLIRTDDGSYSIAAYWKYHLFLLQENAPKPRPLLCNGLPKAVTASNRPPFYGLEFHGPISREKADELLAASGEGSYLVRESRRAENSFTLCIRFDGFTKNYKLFYDGQHYVGEKRFDNVNDLVADGLITMYVEKHASEYIKRMSEETVYDESPYNQYQKMRRKLKSLKNQQHSPEISMTGTFDDSMTLVSRHRNSSEGSTRSLEQDSQKVHRFKMHSFHGPHWCDFCGNYMWGLVQQGVKCEDCGFAAHRKCGEKTLPDCRPDSKYVKRMFGVDLTTFVMAHNIERRGLDTEGLYRISGSHEEIERLRMLFDTEGRVDLRKCRVEDVHTLTGLLKLYFRMLPIPLITHSARREFGRVMSTTFSRERERLRRFRKVMDTVLPPAHYNTTRRFILHLSNVAKRSFCNKMTEENLARILVMTVMSHPIHESEFLILPQQDLFILHYLIDNAKKLFPES